jgi:hypothetical protein
VERPGNCGAGISVHCACSATTPTPLARRDAVVKTVRARLTATSPEWRAFADNEQKIRTEKQPVVADEIASGRP